METQSVYLMFDAKEWLADGREKPVVEAMDFVYKPLLQQAFAQTGGNVAATAKLLRLNRNTCYRDLIRYGILDGTKYKGAYKLLATKHGKKVRTT